MRTCFCRISFTFDTGLTRTRGRDVVTQNIIRLLHFGMCSKMGEKEILLVGARMSGAVSTSIRSFSFCLYGEAKVCRIELTYNPIRLVHDHAIDCCPLSSRNAFTLFHSRHLFFNRSIRIPRWKTTANKLLQLAFKAKASIQWKS